MLIIPSAHKDLPQFAYFWLLVVVSFQIRCHLPRAALPYSPTHAAAASITYQNLDLVTCFHVSLPSVKAETPSLLWKSLNPQNRTAPGSVSVEGMSEKLLWQTKG